MISCEIVKQKMIPVFVSKCFSILYVLYEKGHHTIISWLDGPTLIKEVAQCFIILWTYIVKSSKNSNLLMMEPSATVKMDKWCTYIVLRLCMHFQIHYHMVVIFITSIYMVLMMSVCVLVCGVVMCTRIEWCF